MKKIIFILIVFLFSVKFTYADDSKAYATHGLNQTSEEASPASSAAPSNPANPDEDLWSGEDDAFRQLDAMQSQMNRMMRQLMNQSHRMSSSMPRASYNPDVDLQKSDREYTLKVDLPGVDKDKINIKVEDGRLILSGQREIEKEQEHEGFYRMERGYGAFSRVIPLPSDIDTENVRAEAKDGVLTVKIPRIAKPGASSKTITVR